MDIFYRSTPHPEFGNRYFGLYHSVISGNLMITNADKVENIDFDMIEVDGELHYSRHRHDYKAVGEYAIDGGRAYTKLAGDMSKIKIHKLYIKDGEFVKNES